MVGRTVLGATILLWGAGAAAMQMDWDRSELCGRAAWVGVAEVSSMETRWVPGPEGAIERQVWLTVQYDLEGNLDQDTLSLTLRGGELDGLQHWVEHQPALRLDQPYLIMIEPDSEGGWQLLGGDRGAIALDLGPGTAGEGLEQALASLGSCDANH